MNKMRLDLYLLGNGFYTSREKARGQIMAGNVLLNDCVVDKPGFKVDTKHPPQIRVKEECLYVSRGGYKLAHALDYFKYDVKDKVVLDVGASTGGFTDVCLKRKAKFVYAIDVGTNQLHYSLRRNPHVMSLEQVNARYVSKSNFDKTIQLAVIDVSFISLTKVLEPISKVLAPPYHIISLVKPQFEMEKCSTGFKGVVKDKSIHMLVLEKLIDFVSSIHLEVNDICHSPIKGPKGNIEFFFYISHISQLHNNQSKVDLKVIVDKAWSTLNNGKH